MTDDFSQFHFRVNEHETLRPPIQPMADTIMKCFRREPSRPRRAEKGHHEAIESIRLRFEFTFCRPDVYPTSTNRFDPTERFKLTVGSTYCVDVQAETLRKCTSAWQAFARFQFATRDREHELGRELIADWDGPVAGEPKLHVRQFYICGASWFIGNRCDLPVRSPPRNVAKERLSSRNDSRPDEAR